MKRRSSLSPVFCLAGFVVLSASSISAGPPVESGELTESAEIEAVFEIVGPQKR